MSMTLLQSFDITIIKQEYCTVYDGVIVLRRNRSVIVEI